MRSRAPSTEMSGQARRAWASRIAERGAGVQDIFAGLDWGERAHQLCVVGVHGSRLAELRVDHDVAGLEQLQRALAAFGASLPIAVERAEGLLVEQLVAAGHQVYPVNPRVAARIRERYR